MAKSPLFRLISRLQTNNRGKSPEKALAPVTGKTIMRFTLHGVLLFDVVGDPEQDGIQDSVNDERRLDIALNKRRDDADDAYYEADQDHNPHNADLARIVCRTNAEDTAQERPNTSEKQDGR